MPASADSGGVIGFFEGHIQQFVDTGGHGLFVIVGFLKGGGDRIPFLGRRFDGAESHGTLAVENEVLQLNGMEQFLLCLHAHPMGTSRHIFAGQMRGHRQV